MDNEQDRLHHYTDTDEDYDEDQEERDDGCDDGEEEEEEEEEGRSAENKILCGGPRGGGWSLGKVVDPTATWCREWNRVFLLVCATGLFVDPLFFYTLSISDGCMCLFVDGWMAVTVTVLRCMNDALHAWNIWLQLKMKKRPHDASSRTVALRYLKDKKGFFYDLFVILPLPQVVLWVAIPGLLERGSTTAVMTVFLITFLFQYLPKIYHSVCHLRRMQNLSGYIFGTVWWGIALNMIAYFVAAHAVGACWYLLGIQRVSGCLEGKCRETNGCGVRQMACEDSIYYGTSSLGRDRTRLVWGENKAARASCLQGGHDYDYGSFIWTLPLVTNTSRLEKLLFPIFWGLMTLRYII